MKIENYVYELLLWHDCVIIPGLGGFVSNYLSAEINTSKNLFTPPSKKIAFNKNLKDNDGLLANYIATSENTSFRQAVKMIEEDVEISRNIIKKGKQVTFKGIGKLYFDKEQNLQFEPSSEINFQMDSFGFSEFYSPIIKRQALHKKIEQQFKDRPSVPFDRKSKFKKWAVAAAVLPILATMAWLPLQTDLFNALSLNYSTLIPVSFTPEPAFKPRPETATFKYNNSDDGLDKISFNAYKETTSVPNPLIKESKSISKVNYDKNEKRKSNYFVIGGCFSLAENAEKFIHSLKLKGYSARIVDQHKGLYRVSYTNFTSKEQAIEFLTELKKGENKSAWILSN